MTKEKQIEKEIYNFFKEALKIELEDSPQILNDYIYFEFEGRDGGDVKFRLYYPETKELFVEMNKTKRMFFILSCFVRVEHGQNV